MKYELVMLNTARNSLRYVVRAFCMREIYIPYYICPVIRNALRKEKCKIRFYHIGLDFYPLTEFPSDAFILYPNYFGLSSKIVDMLSKKYNNLIVDNAHSFFSEPRGIASFNSLRKFFPNLKDGSFLYLTKKMNENFDVDDSFYEYRKMSEEEFIKNERKLDFEEIKFISKTTLKYYSRIDLGAEKQRRKDEFQNFADRYSKYNELNIDLSDYDVPFSYPCLFENAQDADSFVSKLPSKIYRYWNNFPENFPEKLFYTNLVSIPL